MTQQHGHGEELFVPLDGGAGPAVPLQAARAEALARAAVRAARPMAGASRFMGGRAAIRWPAQLAAGAALCLLGGGVALAAFTWLRPVEPVAAPRVQSAPAPAPDRSAPAPVRPVAPVVVETPTVVEAPESADSPPPASRVPDTGELLSQANRLRAQGRYAQAERLYLRVAQASVPGDAHVATVAAAALKLQHRDDPAAALSLYRRALRQRPDGPLAATARFGVAESQRALGQVQAERDALRAFITAHPRHMLRAKADARLAALGE